MSQSLQQVEEERQRVQSLAAEIASMADENFGAHRRDISVAAQTIMACADPSAADGSVGLVVRLSPYVPSGSRLELHDGRHIKGVAGIEVVDERNERRIVKATLLDLPVLGQPTLNQQGR